MANAMIGLIQKYSWIILILILTVGWFSPLLMFITFISMFAPIAFSLKYGRAWCGNYCIRGSFNNSVLKIISPNKKIPVLLRKPYFRFIVFLTLMTLFVFNLALSAWTWNGLGVAFLKMMALTTLIEICLAVFIQQNAWCMICPMGTLSGFISKLTGKSKANVVFCGDCTSCDECKVNCPVQIDVSQYCKEGKVTHIDCLKCRTCIENCPNKALEWEMRS